MTDIQEKYMELLEKLREYNKLIDSGKATDDKEYDDLLDSMDPLWHRMSHEEEEEVEAMLRIFIKD